MNTASTPAPGAAPTPLSTTIAPGTTQVVIPAAAPAPAPGYLLSDADIAYASTLGNLAKDLKLTGAEAPAAAEGTPKTNDAAKGTAAAPTSQEPSPGAAATPPANETPEQKVARLEAELAQLKTGKTLPSEEAAKKGEPATGGGPAPAQAPKLPIIAPTAANPLVNLREAKQFAVAEEAARALRDWAFANRDGGALPADLQQKIENAEAVRTGREPMTISQPIEISAEQAAALHNNAARMLEKDLPDRRNAANQESTVLAHVQQSHPALWDPQTPEGKAAQVFIGNYPHLLSTPDWPLMLRDMVTGYLANQPKTGGAAETAKPEVQAPAPTKAAAAQRPTVETEDGKVVPFAGGEIPTGGSAPARVPYSQREIDEAYTRLQQGKASDADMIILGAAAV